MSTELVYKLEGIDPEIGVDVYEIAPVLMQFGNLVRAAADELDLGMEMDVRVKPFKEGSWIAQFVLHLGPIQSLLSYLATPEGQSVEHLLMLLFGIGIPAGVSVAWVTKVIRHTKGDVSRFTPSEGGTFTYLDERNQGITVEGDVHTLIQSPAVQFNLYGSGVAPLDKFHGISAVVLEGGDSSQERFTDADKSTFTRYAKVELAEEVEETIVPMHGILVRPHRGSYDGEGTRYSFTMGDTTLWPVTIADECFLGDIKSGVHKLHGGDVLLVDIEMQQKRSARTGGVTNRYIITRVIEYWPYTHPEQTTLVE